MTDHLHRDLTKVKEQVLAMGGLAEEALQSARSALQSSDPSSLERLRGIELRIDTLQLQIDDQVLKLLALHQPVAGDLRFAMAAMKIVNDLERVGDLASTIGERLLIVMKHEPLLVPLDFERMMAHTANMLARSLNAFVTLDSSMARQVIKDDDLIDEINRTHFQTLTAEMKRSSDSVDAALSLLSISRCIERIADMSTNIAEDVVFVAEATDIRHPKLDA